MAPTLAGGGHGKMAAMAAMLMRPPAPDSLPPAAATPNIPRSVPNPQATASATDMQPTQHMPHSNPYPTAQASGRSAYEFSAADSRQAPSVTQAPALSENSGPSLRGTPDQLKAARELAASSTKAGNKSRPTSRQRLLSTEPRQMMTSTTNRTHGSSVASSNRSSAASTAAPAGYAAPMASPRPRPSIARAPAPAAATTGPTPANGMGQWQSLRGQPSVTGQAASKEVSSSSNVVTQTPSMIFRSEVPVQQSLPPFSFGQSSNVAKENMKPVLNTSKGTSNGASVSATATNGAPAVSASPDVPKAPSWHMQNITNTLNDRASNALPPHTRSKQAMPQATSQAAAPPLSALASREGSAAPMSELPVVGGTQDAEKTTHSDNSVKPPPTLSAQSKAITRQNSVVGATQQIVEKPLTNGSASLEDGSMAIIRALKTELAATTSRLATLEQENFVLWKQVEAMVQAEERRKFLGTDSASSPYGLKVQTPSGNTITVQATAALKVGELIRRIRAKADLSAADSQDPRISLDDQQLGHGMTLGEVGVTQKTSLAFTYSNGR